jgi:hypothetical protein
VNFARVRLGLLQARCTMVGFENMIALCLQCDTSDSANGFIILNQQYGFGCKRR